MKNGKQRLSRKAVKVILLLIMLIILACLILIPFNYSWAQTPQPDTPTEFREISKERALQCMEWFDPVLGYQYPDFMQYWMILYDFDPCPSPVYSTRGRDIFYMEFPIEIEILTGDEQN